MERESEREKQREIPHDQVPEGPGYTPQARTRLPEELVDQARRRVPAAQGQAPGTFLNLKSGQVHIATGNPPRGEDWLFLFPDTSLSLDDIRQVVRRAGLEDVLGPGVTIHY